MAAGESDRPRKPGLVCLFVGIVCLCGHGAPDRQIRISHFAQSLHPGEVVLLSVVSAAPLQHVEATALGRLVPFWPSADGRSWNGLVGIDLAAKAGESAVAIRATSGEADIAETYSLQVAPARFGTRRLTLPAAFVTPPKSELGRIERENGRVAAILDQSGGERLWTLPFIEPVPGVAVSSFGTLSILNGQVRSRHNGTDFRAAEGSPVNAPNAGRVVLADDLYYSGKTVILDHGQGLFSYLGHFSRLAVTTGDLVARGQLVGYAGATGRVTGPHLHWGARLGGARVDPLSLVAVFALRSAASQ